MASRAHNKRHFFARFYKILVGLLRRQKRKYCKNHDFTPQKHTQGQSQYLQYLPPQLTTWCVSFFACYVCRVPPAKFGAIGETSQVFLSAIFNAYFPSIYPTVLHAPAKLLICMILVEQNISIKAKNPRCLRNLACVVFYHEPAKYPSQIDSQISITLTGQSTELEKDFMGVCRWNN